MAAILVIFLLVLVAVLLGYVRNNAAVLFLGGTGFAVLAVLLAAGLSAAPTVTLLAVAGAIGAGIAARFVRRAASGARTPSLVDKVPCERCGRPVMRIHAACPHCGVRNAHRMPLK